MHILPTYKILFLKIQRYRFVRNMFYHRELQEY